MNKRLLIFIATLTFFVLYFWDTLCSATDIQRALVLVTLLAASGCLAGVIGCQTDRGRLSR